MDFSGDCRIATQFCTLLSRHPWLCNTNQERKIHGFFRVSEICNANLRVAKPPLHGLFIDWQESGKKQTLCHCRVVGELSRTTVGEPVEPRLVSLVEPRLVSLVEPWLVSLVEPRLVSLSNHDPTIFFRIAHSPPLSRHAEFISASVPVCVQDLQMWHSYKGSDTRSSANLPFNLHAKLYLFYYQTENAVHHKQGNQ